MTNYTIYGICPDLGEQKQIHTKHDLIHSSRFFTVLPKVIHGLGVEMIVLANCCSPVCLLTMPEHTPCSSFFV